MRVLLAAGKTGGHIFPALALAQEFIRRDEAHEILLVGSREKIAAKIFEQQDIRWEAIDAKPLKGTGLIGKAQAMLMLIAGLRQANKIIERFRPQVVVGLGGYSCAPLVMAAVFRKIPCFLQEQNFIPGFTNRCLGRFVEKIFTSFPESEKFFSAGRAIFAGNPVRSQLIDKEPDYRSFGLEAGRFTVLVFGGSQGAHKLNLVMPEAAQVLLGEGVDFQVVHQTGEADCGLVKKAYAGLGISAYVSPFIEEMSAAYAVADIVFCRAGATSIAELEQTGKASILVPYPYAANDHQTFNARYLADKGAALMIPESELSARRLADEIKTLALDADRRCKMGKQALQLARPEAARTIVGYLVENFKEKQSYA